MVYQHQRAGEGDQHAGDHAHHGGGGGLQGRGLFGKLSITHSQYLSNVRMEMTIMSLLRCFYINSYCKVVKCESKLQY